MKEDESRKKSNLKIREHENHRNHTKDRADLVQLLSIPTSLIDLKPIPTL